MTQSEHTALTPTVEPSGGGNGPTVLSFIVPAYNMAGYLNRCVASLLSSRSEDVEVVLVDDGSQDATPALADRWAREHAGRVRVIHQTNKGHGGAVNAGLDAARGMYVKVVDADDWVDPDALARLLPVLRRQTHAPSPVDMFVTNYVYEKEGRSHKHVVNFRSVMAAGHILSWSDLKRFGIAQYMIMHALVFRTDVLRRAATRLPEHTFYVDFIYSYQPLPFVRSLAYLDIDLYRYYTGRDGQSVQTSVMISRVDQLLTVNRLMVEATPERGSVPDGLYRYMIHYLSINCVVTSVFLILSKRPENYRAKQSLWKRMNDYSPTVSHDVRHTFLCRLINMPGKPGRLAIRLGYRIAEAAVGFN
ncbi:glycosyltransferase family 2 protein [Bifidobacterium xylocopae]|uniref:Glycosyl transferase n=1 Tax=Bifidobacterium xylocopae TaxID=2493119 RepID=A0A366KG92_9BIFI|nr:glycosyltransferase family 2 protein [Bifidobacterium xylocopae]RBP99711.1 glycosyl transferase [Bifidobacterium xylocopae]